MPLPKVLAVPPLEHLDPANYLRVPWKNGRGVLVDIARQGDGWDGAGLIWHYGRTAIIEPGPFSDLSGYERLQVVIKGQGLVLVTPAGDIDLREPFRPRRYDGGTPIVTRLEQGPVEVANLIADRRKVEIDLRVASSGDVIACRPGEHIVHAAAETACVTILDETCPLREDHAVRFRCATAIGIQVGSGRVLIASVYPLGA